MMRPSLASKKILIIDDSSTDRVIYRRYLERAGIRSENILEASRGDEGIIRVTQETLDCIILDFHLPDQDGLKVLEQIRPATEAKIIFISGDPAPHMVEAALAKGATLCLIKDQFSYDEWLEATLRSIS